MNLTFISQRNAPRGGFLELERYMYFNLIFPHADVDLSYCSATEVFALEFEFRLFIANLNGGRRRTHFLVNS